MQKQMRMRRPQQRATAMEMGAPAGSGLQRTTTPPEHTNAAIQSQSLRSSHMRLQNAGSPAPPLQTRKKMQQSRQQQMERRQMRHTDLLPMAHQQASSAQRHRWLARGRHRRHRPCYRSVSLLHVPLKAAFPEVLHAQHRSCQVSSPAY